MGLQELLDKYSLPKIVKVLIKKSSLGTYSVYFPDYAGCMTYSENFVDLYDKITDAILTYFEVPRKEALKLNIIYYPSPKKEMPSLRKLEKPSPNKDIQKQVYFSYYLAPNLHGSSNIWK